MKIRELFLGLSDAGDWPTQSEVSARLKRPQSFIASIETRQRRVDVVELLDLAKAIGFDPHEVIRRLSKVATK